MKIVCISGKAQHGKDTTAKLLEETLKAQGNRVLIAHYGDLVKYVCKTFFGWDGKKDEKGRTLLQRVGTDKIRAVSPDYWVDFIVSILDIFCDEWDYVLIPDTRFHYIDSSLEEQVKAITGAIESELFIGYDVEIITAE